MLTENMQHLFAMVIYMLAVVGIGIYFAKRANTDAEAYFLGGRSLGPWVAAFSAEASDMSGWLLMGLPGLAYWTGLADAGWTAIGLFVGTYLNWLVVSKRLHNYSVKVDAITIPGFFSERFHEKKKIILTISSLFIIIFFTVYAGQCLAACGKLFNSLFDLPYHEMMIVAALFVLLYTFLGGFLAESASDFMQAVVMIIVLVAIFVLAVANAGGWAEVVANAKSYDGYFSLFTTSSPSSTVVNGFGGGSPFKLLSILSALAWGLGYFGMPQVLLRFMGIRSAKELTRSRRVACIWLFISMTAAVLIGIVGRSVAGIGYLSNAEAESIFIDTATSFLPPILAGFACAGILAASISSSDSYLLISTSALAENLYHGIFKKNASNKEVMWVARIAMALITIIAMVIAWDSNSTIFSITSFAWAGFGATFGPLMLFSLFWKRTSYVGAIAGMLSGGIMVFVWKLLINPLGGIWGVYSLLPAFIISSIVIVAVSLMSKKPSQQIEDEFDAVVKM
ncbi:MAG: sodium/proline symporter [Eubacteriales bacterium]|nr:sodium/proline symporter [Eubacteriales bacterium]